MKNICSAAALGVLAQVLAANVASASSPDAWQAFRADIRKKCLAAAEGKLTKVRIRVDPFSGESYGFAVLDGNDAYYRHAATRLCIYDKVSKKAELTEDVQGLIEPKRR